MNKGTSVPIPLLIMVQLDETIWFVRIWLKEIDRKTGHAMDNQIFPSHFLI